jgi:P27 family predicted phage terminase small subunit
MPRDRIAIEDHELRGTRAQYVLPDSDVAAGRPKYPKNISGEAKSTFKRLVKMLEARRTCTQGDCEILRLYAILFDRHARAVEHISLEGEIVQRDAVSKNGEVYRVDKENPWLAVAQNCETKMSNLLQQLGLTPRTRATVKSAKEKLKPETQFPTREQAVEKTDEAPDLNGIDENSVAVN